MGFVRHLFGKSTLAGVPTPEPTPAATPEPTPVSQPSLSEPSLPPIYVIRDVVGIAVDLSHQSVDPEHPAQHAAQLLRALMHDDAMGGPVLEKVIKKYYRTICPNPLPWPSVLLHLNKILREAYGDTSFKTYKWVQRGRRRRRLRVYHIPRAEGDLQGEPFASVA
jgi:hypothetical protein